METIGIIGLGLMGTAMAERSIEAGRDVVAYDVNADRCKALQEAGASIVTSASDMLNRCRALVIAVYDVAQVETTLESIAGKAASVPPVLICTTTCSPEDISRIAMSAAAAGYDFVEMPVSGTSAEVRAGLATCLIAGEAEIVASVRDAINMLFPRSVMAGKIGDASRIKLAINLILQINRAALAEGIVFAEKMGLDGNAFLRAARASAAYSSVMDTKGEKMLRQDYRQQSRISQTLKDAELILKAARQHDLKLPVMAAQAALLRSAVHLMGGDCDSSAVVEAIRLQNISEESQ